MLANIVQLVVSGELSAGRRGRSATIASSRGGLVRVMPQVTNSKIPSAPTIQVGLTAASNIKPITELPDHTFALILHPPLTLSSLPLPPVSRQGRPNTTQALASFRRTGNKRSLVKHLLAMSWFRQAIFLRKCSKDINNSLLPLLLVPSNRPPSATCPSRSRKVLLLRLSLQLGSPV